MFRGYLMVVRVMMVWMMVLQVLVMRGQESLPALPKHQWVFMVGPTWTQAYNEETDFKWYGDNQLLLAESPSYYRRLQPYVGIERFTHIGDRWVYSLGMSYHERYTDNLKPVKYLVRSVNVELQGGEGSYSAKCVEGHTVLLCAQCRYIDLSMVFHCGHVPWAYIVGAGVLREWGGEALQSMGYGGKNSVVWTVLQVPGGPALFVGAISVWIGDEPC